MNVATSSLFSQLLSLVDRNRFAKLVRETGSEQRSKGFASWDHFIAMLFCQLAQAKSLREIDGGLSSCEGKLKHLGMTGAPGRSTLSYANAHRSSDPFEKLFYQVLGNVSLHAPGKKFRFNSKLYSLDSTVIELCASMFDWAKFRATKGAAKLHLLLDHDGHLPCYAMSTEGKVAEVTIAQQLKLPKGSLVVMDRGYNDYRLFARWTAEGVGFVTRLKKNALWASHESRPVKPGGKVRRDAEGKFFDFDASRRIEIAVSIPDPPNNPCFGQQWRVNAPPSEPFDQVAVSVVPGSKSQAAPSDKFVPVAALLRDVALAFPQQSASAMTAAILGRLFCIRLFIRGQQPAFY
jgi:hypothetical protein